MQANWPVTRCLAMLAVTALIVSACAPLPPLWFDEQAPTATMSPSAIEPATSPSAPPPTIQVKTPPPVTAPTFETAASGLVGVQWEWVSSTFKDGTVLAPGDPSRYTFQLLPDGNAVVQADCNFGSATHTETPGRFSFGAIGTTKMACPPDSLDSEFLGQLRNIDRYELSAEGLLVYLLDEAGVMQLRAGDATMVDAGAAPPTPPSSAMPAPPDTPTPQPPPATPVQGEGLAELDGSSWTLVTLGKDTAPLTGTSITMAFSADGSHVSGSTGCNEYRAVVSTDGAGLKLVAPALMTRKSCAAEVKLQEVTFIDLLLQTRSYTVREERLILTGADDAALLLFDRM